MKSLIPTILFSLTSFLMFAQNQEVKPTNQTIIRITIIKDNDKILMRETEYGWMTPAVYFTERQTIQEILDSLSSNYGIKMSSPILSGLFTYKYEFKPTADLRQLYTATYISGNLISKVGMEKLYWMPIEEALVKLGTTVQALEDMTKQVTEHPRTLWGGSFVLDRVEGKLTSKIEENFYPLSGNKQ